MKKIFIRAACLTLAFLFLCGFSLPPQKDTVFAAICQSEETVQAVLNSGIRGMIHEHEWVYITTFPYKFGIEEDGAVVSVFAIEGFAGIPCVFCNYCHENLSLKGIRKKTDIESHLNTHDRTKKVETHIEWGDFIEYDYEPSEEEIHDYYMCTICHMIKAE